MAYCYVEESDASFSDTEGRLRAALKEQGFGIITEIDVRKTMKEKLGKDVSPYKILGACNPGFAHQAIEAEPNVGVLLPCNVVVREQDGKVIVGAILPSVQLGKVGNEALAPIAMEVERRLCAAVRGSVLPPG